MMATPTSKPPSAPKKTGSDPGTRKKSATKKVPPRSVDGSSSGEASERAGRSSDEQASAPRAQARPRPKPAQVAAQAARELLQLTGREAEGVTGIERTEDGWTIQVEVVETRRIPNTTDILALYEIQADEQGGLEGYRRVRRYVRGTPGEN
jgi:hypothetical protein